ncbi:cytochrome b [Humitalea sp. 24SJ18S-53]|uniref:cytochrome b n=1 Tax=Humitalea sp. 24SJ18S-53 TaxID=3422307 RepID=UPI003D66491D
MQDTITLNGEPVRGYSAPAKWFHWITVVLLAIALTFGFILSFLAGGFKDEFAPTKFALYAIHESAGLTLFFVAVLRLAWRLFNPPPPLPDSIPPVFQKAAAVVHHVLYTALILQPILGFFATNAWGFPMSGSTAYLGFINLPKFMEANVPLAEWLALGHTTVAYVIVVALVMHIGGVIFHQAIRRDGTLLRMV